MPWRSIAVMSSILLLTGCSLFQKTNYPPCDRSEVVKAVDPGGHVVYRVNSQCFDRMLRDLDVCYDRAKP